MNLDKKTSKMKTNKVEKPKSDRLGEAKYKKFFRPGIKLFSNLIRRRTPETNLKNARSAELLGDLEHGGFFVSEWKKENSNLEPKVDPLTLANESFCVEMEKSRELLNLAFNNYLLMCSRYVARCIAENAPDKDLECQGALTRSQFSRMQFKCLEFQQPSIIKVWFESNQLDQDSDSLAKHCSDAWSVGLGFDEMQPPPPSLVGSIQSLDLVSTGPAPKKPPRRNLWAFDLPGLLLSTATAVSADHQNTGSDSESGIIFNSEESSKSDDEYYDANDIEIWNDEQSESEVKGNVDEIFINKT